MTTIKCTVCGEEKDFTLFEKRSRLGDVRRKQCRSCRIKQKNNKCKRKITQTNYNRITNYPKRKNKLCLNCGKTFSVIRSESKRLYCSLKCKLESKPVIELLPMKPMFTKLINCHNCNKPFEQHWQTQKFCNRYECVEDVAIKRKEKVYRGEKIDIQCYVCGKQFKKVLLNNNKYNYCCSDDCRRILCKKKTVTKECIVCGKEYYYHLNFKTKDTGRRKFCSIRCGRLYNCRKRRAMRKKATVENIDYNIIRIRDKGKCHICGKKVRYDVDHLHPLSENMDHIIPLSKGGDHTYTNIKLSHRSCNIEKRGRITML